MFNRENISITIGRIIAHSISDTITPAEQAVLDEWLHRKRMAITADDFGWASDSFVILPLH